MRREKKMWKGKGKGGKRKEGMGKKGRESTKGRKRIVEERKRSNFSPQNFLL